ncbi:MAG: hypothetical protein JEZ04_10740 [Spirochaetales bacterium]|nr:hypothetical protein [Spirochaetales bacterium]
MENSKKKSDDITMLDVLIFFIRNRKILLISFLISIVVGTGYYVYPTNENKKLETPPPYAQMEFRYHHPFYELQHRIKAPKEYLEELIVDEIFLKDMINITLEQLGIKNVEENDVEQLVKNLIENKKLSIKYGSKVKNTEHEYIVYTKLYLNDFPDFINPEKFGKRFLLVFYNNANLLINPLLKKDAQISIEKDYAFFKSLDEVLREIEKENVQKRVTSARTYLEDLISGFSGRRTVVIIEESPSIGTVPIVEGSISVTSNKGLYIFLILCISFIPISIKYVLIGIRNIIKNPDFQELIKK